MPFFCKNLELSGFPVVSLHLILDFFCCSIHDSPLAVISWTVMLLTLTHTIWFHHKFDCFNLFQFLKFETRLAKLVPSRSWHSQKSQNLCHWWWQAQVG
jgi:hypothetical protein